jgi:hypothetical protein
MADNRVEVDGSVRALHELWDLSRYCITPIGTMYTQGVRYTIGWANIQALMPKVLDLLAQRRVPVERIHTVARWDDAIEAIKSPTAKLILARELAYL